MSSRSAHILVAEDDKSVRLVVQQALARQGYTCLLYTSPSPRDS